MLSISCIWKKNHEEYFYKLLSKTVSLQLENNGVNHHRSINYCDAMYIYLLSISSSMYYFKSEQHRIKCDVLTKIQFYLPIFKGPINIPAALSQIFSKEDKINGMSFVSCSRQTAHCLKILKWSILILTKRS